MNKEFKKELIMKTMEWVNLVDEMKQKHTELIQYITKLRGDEKNTKIGDYSIGDSKFIRRCADKIREATFVNDDLNTTLHTWIRWVYEPYERYAGEVERLETYDVDREIYEILNDVGE